jgi:hypothetical protein
VTQAARSSESELAPRPPVHHKRKAGRRHKLASTIAGALYELVRAKESEGYQFSDLIDSAFWVFFGKLSRAEQKCTVVAGQKCTRLRRIEGTK